MELMTSRWTDDRMDDLKHQVGELGRRMEEGFAEQRKEMNARFDRIDAQFDKIDDRFEKVDARFEKVDARFEKIDDRFEKIDDRFDRTQEMIIGLHATVTRVSLTFAVALVGLVATQTGLILTQL
jgi:predicted nuclease with TOPRIM domain